MPFLKFFMSLAALAFGICAFVLLVTGASTLAIVVLSLVAALGGGAFYLLRRMAGS